MIKNKLFSELKFILIILLYPLSCIMVTQHDYYKAISSANKTLWLLFNKEYEKAYNELHLEAKEKVPFEIFSEMMQMAFCDKMAGNLKKMKFDYYVPVTGEKAIQLYYKIAYNNPSMGNILHLVLLGDAVEGYRVYILDFGNVAKYPPNVKYFNQKKQKIKEDIVIETDTIIITPDSLREGFKFY